MDEMNIQTIPDIPENALPPEPEYIIKKKFCFATIPAMITMLTTFFMVGYNIFVGIYLGINFTSTNEWIFVEQGILYGIQFVAVFLLCILMFAKLNKPFLCVPLLVTALTYAVHLFSLIAVYDRNGFIISFRNYLLYRYPSHMTIRISYWIFLAVMIFSFVFAAVYVILASIEKTNGKVRKLWLIPAVVSVLSLVMYIVYEIVYVSFFAVKTDYNSQAAIMSSVIGALMNLVVYIPQTVTVILLCKWISNPFKKVLKKAPKAPAPQPVMYVPVPQPVQTIPVPHAPVPDNQATEQKNNIELIKQYKDLLDMGAITQEEYEEKKKDLLTK
ncbi:MAG: SHOCT domain-containing protein [Acutalibacteraceae bacterium]|nr:SHOCT domain-containing protein [Acutalibacteraceae bacterium]